MRVEPDSANAEIMGLVKRGEFDEALGQCTKWLTVCSRRDAHDFLAMRSYAFWRAGQKMSAIADARAAAFLRPIWPGHLHRLMRWYTDLCNYEQSLVYARRLIRLEHKRGSDAFLRSAYLHALFALAQKGESGDFKALYDEIDPGAVERIQGKDRTASEIKELLR